MTKSEKINSELASFYSDLAAISTISPTDGESTAGQITDPSTSSDGIAATTDNTPSLSVPDGEAAAKKRKKKVKKLEPWRSGNLETWINKWQKAQKELDG